MQPVIRPVVKWNGVLCGLIVMGAALFMGTVARAELYSLTDLGSLGGTESGAVGINAAGQVVGYSYLAGNPIYHAFLYSNGAMTDLGTLGGPSASIAYGINSAGQVVGTAGNVNHAFLYTNGTMTDLGTLGGLDSVATGINAAGQIAGYSATSPGNIRHAFLYNNGTMTDLGTLGGNTSFGKGINSAGQVVGMAQIPSGTDRAFLYSNGTMTDLGTLGGTAHSDATGINDAGQVVGWAFTAGNAAQHAFLLSNGTMTDLGTLGGTLSVATGLNNAGQVVGLSKTAGDVAEHAFVYHDGILTDLNSLLDATGAGWTLTSAWAINSNGQIVGKGLNPHGQQGAFLLTRVVNRQPTCSAAQAFPSALWSPNHQFVPIIVVGVTDPDGDAVTTTVTGVTQDEPVNATGDGNTSPDAVIQAGAASVRAERSGNGNGRVYQISFTADDGKGGSCSGAVTITVPHSQKKGLIAIDDGQIYNSTIP